MLIKFKDRIFNASSLSCVEKHQSNYLKFHMNELDQTTLGFDSEDQRDGAFEEILDAYRWQRQVCNLG